ncbi:MAG: hypothetical protein KJ958_05530 [Gammaproteobacteria bacterium]|nr:hypothetical protein [Gammaproteobacteria bacterium]MBU1978615.1 hypothetical protein [Gammaproteobacteria bacterium]
MFTVMDEDKAKEIKNWPVTINIPGDGGAITKAEIRCDFLLLKQDEIDSIIQAAREGDDSSDLMEKVWIGFNGVQDAAGTTIEFSAPNRDRLLKISYLRSAVTREYFNAVNGGKPKRGN